MNEHIVLFSGGKDSTAMLFRMLELNMPIDKVIFCNTTLEFPELYKYVYDIRDYLKKEYPNIKFIEVKPKKTFNDWFYGKYTKGSKEGEIRGMPYVIGHSWCCREFKIYPSKLCSGKGNKLYIGYAKGEERRKQNNKDHVYPLIEWGWTEEMCLNYLRKIKRFNPLYSKFRRLGCWLCPKQNLESLKILCLHYPNHYKLLKKYEKDSPHGFKPYFKLSEFEKEFKGQRFLK